MPRHSAGHRPVAAFALAALALLAHGRSITSDFIWDDDAYVTENKTLRSLDGLRQIWLDPQATPQYYPLVHTSYWLEYRLWGLKPTGYHAVNVALHVLSAVLLWRLLLRLDVPAAWLGAALFAVHPVGVESVSWVTERKNTLSMVFALLAAHAWLRFRFDEGRLDLRPTDLRAPQRLRWLCIAIACFALALFSKTVAAMLVGMLAGVVWWKTGRLRGADLAALAPLVVIGLPLALFTVWLEKHHVGAKNVEWHLTPPDRLLIAGRAACFYGSKLVWPQPLAFFYTRWSIDARQAWQWIFPLAVAAAAAAAWAWRGRIGRAPAAVIGMYLCGLFPALGFFDVFPFKYSFVADHFQYHALPVGLAALAAGLALAAARLRLPLLPLAAGLLTVLAALSFARSGVFSNPETLYLDTLAQTPTSSIAANNLGAWYQQHDRLEEAREFLMRGAATAIFPDEKSRGLSNLAMVLLRQDRVGEAVEAARLALAANAEPRTRAVMALSLVRAGRLDDAQAALAAASAKDLDYPEMQLARGEAALTAGDIAAALRHFAAFTADPEPAKRDRALLEVGIALAQHGLIEEATATFDRIAGSPRMVSKARVNLGVVHARRGDLPAAVAAFEAAVVADPASPDAHGNLAKALLATGNRAAALRHFAASRALAGKSFAFEEDYRRAAAGSPRKELP